MDICKLHGGVISSRGIPSVIIITMSANLQQYVILCSKILSDNISYFPVPFHVLVNESFLVRAEMANHRLCDVIAIDLLSELTNQHSSLLFHLVNLTLHIK